MLDVVRDRRDVLVARRAARCSPAGRCGRSGRSGAARPRSRRDPRRTAVEDVEVGRPVPDRRCLCHEKPPLLPSCSTSTHPSCCSPARRCRFGATELSGGTQRGPSQHTRPRRTVSSAAERPSTEPPEHERITGRRRRMTIMTIMTIITQQRMTSTSATLPTPAPVRAGAGPTPRARRRRGPPRRPPWAARRRSTQDCGRHRSTT